MAQSEAMIVMTAIMLSPVKSASKFNRVALKMMNPTAIMVRIKVRVFIELNLSQIEQSLYVLSKQFHCNCQQNHSENLTDDVDAAWPKKTFDAR